MCQLWVLLLNFLGENEHISCQLFLFLASPEKNPLWAEWNLRWACMKEQDSHIHADEYESNVVRHFY